MKTTGQKRTSYRAEQQQQVGNVVLNQHPFSCATGVPEAARPRRDRRPTAHHRQQRQKDDERQQVAVGRSISGGSIVASGRRGGRARIILPKKTLTGKSREQSCHTSNATAGPTSG